VEAELKKVYPDASIKLIKGGGGVFDVKCDGKLIYSKFSIAEQRFPREGEITRLVEQMKD